MVLLDDAGWPVISDDTGNGTSGTEVDKAWADGVKDAIDSLTND